MNVDSAKSQLAHAQDHIEDVLFVINIEKPLKPKDEELRATLVCLFLNLQALIQTQDGLISGSRAMRFFWSCPNLDPDEGWTYFRE